MSFGIQPGPCGEPHALATLILKQMCMESWGLHISKRNQCVQFLNRPLNSPKKLAERI